MGANTPMTKETQKFIREINKMQKGVKMDELERAVQQYNAVVQQNKDLQKEVIHLRTRLNEYEKYGGVLDEGKAWADEAMESRRKINAIREIAKVNAVDSCWKLLNTCSDCILQSTCGTQSPFTVIKDILKTIEENK